MGIISDLFQTDCPGGVVLLELLAFELTLNQQRFGLRAQNQEPGPGY